MKQTFRYSFRWRLMVSFLSISLIPLLLCSLMLVQVVNIRANSRTFHELGDYTGKVLNTLDQLSGGLTDVSVEMQNDPNLVSALSGRSVPETAIYNRFFSASNDIRKYCDLYILDCTGKIHYETNSGSLKTAMSTHLGILNRAREAEGRSVFSPLLSGPEGSPAVLQSAVTLTTESGQHIGYLLLEISEEQFQNLFRGKIGSYVDLLLVDRFWRPVYASQENLEQAEQMRSQLFKTGCVKMEDADNLLSVTHHEPTGLYLILRQSKVFNQKTMQTVHTVSMICVLICTLISVAVSLVFSRQISYPVRHLQLAFGKLEQEDLDVQVSADRQDELGQLAQSFNRMVTTLRHNREEARLHQKELNEARVRMLLAQLNPHFLCNTLDTMKWISKIHKVPEVALMATNLADILRMSISGEVFVPLSRELQVLERYVEIQRIRLSGHFDFVVNIPDETADCLVPKMLLQPIVENAIIHGLRGVDHSRICVEAVCIDEAHLSIAVTDNGTGLPTEMAGKRYERQSVPEGNHLGLYNVDSILKIHYGTDYGLYLDNGPDGSGTTVTAIMPIRKEGAVC